MGSMLVRPKGSRIREEDLLDQERIFCAEYLANGLNMSEAVRVAYPKRDPKRAVQQGCKLMKRPRVKNYLGKMLHTRLTKAGLTTDRILRHLEVGLFLDPLSLFEEVKELPGVYRVKSLDEIPQEVRSCINKIRTRLDPETGEPDIYFEFMSKTKLLELAMKHLGLLKEAGLTLNLSAVGSVSFDQLCSPEEATVDPVEQRLALEQKSP